jgi:class 3 adenylate cyclase
LTKPFSRDELLARLKTHLHLRSINKVTNKFVPTQFIRSLGRDSITEVRLGDQIQKLVTVMFADIRGYTSLAETMTPEENFNFINSFDGRMGPIIADHKGFINQYLGDAIMALFATSPQDALDAAINMQLALANYNQERESKGRAPVEFGVGLHTGKLIMGVVGDSQRMDTATIADSVNTASRIESLTKYYGVNILVSQSSLDLITQTSDYMIRYLGEVQVKGKEKPVAIYECFQGDLPKLRELKIATLRDFKIGLKLYFSKDFPKATVAFQKVLDSNPDDSTAKLFLKHSGQYITSDVPADWTGVEVMTFK